MATLIQPESDLQPSGEPLPLRPNPVSDPRAFRGPLQRVASALAAPILLVIALLGLVVVVADLNWYRLRSLVKGRPQPRGLWEI